MTPERWRRVKEIFAHASALAVEAREKYLTSLELDDAELHAEIVSLLAAHETADAVVDLSAADYLPNELRDTSADSWIGRRIGAYKLIALLGRGGMGAVFRAHRADKQFEKAVAIKLMHGGYESDFILQRFKAERQILANLDHPNIARLLDGGATADGSPYLVMELIDGRPIDRYCEENNLTIGARLKLFRDVCAAVSYAHQRLIVHRDLKPSNILVTKDGTIKLLDFGIAKLIQATPSETDTNVTMTALRALTPSFSSPEQILGQPITTTSDVYSLGVVLFHLLTGCSPYRSPLSTTQDAIREVCETEATKPSVVAQARNHAEALVPHRDLDDIVLKALRKEPDKRYSSVEQFSDDIRRYLDGQPVLAHEGRLSYRAQKFARRHKVGVAASLVVVLAIAAGIAATLREAGIARHEAEIAQIERARAEKRFNDVRQLSDSLIFDIHDAIQNLPGATPARKVLLDRAVEYLDSVSKDAAGDPDLQRELAWGYQRLAVVQGNPTESNLGDESAALASDRKALANFAAVAEANPSNVIDQLNVAMMHRILAYSSLTEQSGHDDLAQAMTITERLLKLDPANSKIKSERSIEYQNFGLMQDAAGDRIRALEAFRENQQLKLKILNTDPNYRNIRRSVGNATIMLGIAQARIDQRREALQTLEQGIAYYESASTGTDVVNTKRELAHSKQTLGDVQFKEGDLKAAKKSYLESRIAFESLAKADPQNTLLQSDLAWADFHDGRVLLLSHRHSEAIEHLRHALSGFEALPAPTQTAIDAINGKASIHLWLADAYDDVGDLRNALTNDQLAAKTLGVEPTTKTSDDTRCDLALSYIKVASIQSRLGNQKEALATVEKGLSIVAPSLVPVHQDVPALYVFASGHAERGAILTAQARAEHDAERRLELERQARTAYEQSLNAWKQIPNPSRISPNGFRLDEPTQAIQRLQRLLNSKELT